MEESKRVGIEKNEMENLERVITDDTFLDCPAYQGF